MYVHILEDFLKIVMKLVPHPHSQTAFVQMLTDCHLIPDEQEVVGDDDVERIPDLEDDGRRHDVAQRVARRKSVTRHRQPGNNGTNLSTLLPL
jgi:hypothetical protein